MGNHLSCMSPVFFHRLHQQVVSSNPDSSKSLINILHYNGAFVAQLEEPLSAAEVMMEFPGLFLCCHSLSLSRAGRISAIPADEDLCAGELYILLPMNKLNARFSSEEIAYFTELALMQKKTSIDGFGDSPPHHDLECITATASGFDKIGGHGAESIQSLCAGRLTAPFLMRSFSAKLERPVFDATCNEPMCGNILEESGTAAPLQAVAQKGITMCRSRSWMPNLETITEARAAF